MTQVREMGTGPFVLEPGIGVQNWDWLGKK